MCTIPTRPSLLPVTSIAIDKQIENYGGGVHERSIWSLTGVDTRNGLVLAFRNTHLGNDLGDGATSFIGHVDDDLDFGDF
jgi:hypothetical protein